MKGEIHVKQMCVKEHIVLASVREWKISRLFPFRNPYHYQKGERYMATYAVARLWDVVAGPELIQYLYQSAFTDTSFLRGASHCALVECCSSERGLVLE